MEVSSGEDSPASLVALVSYIPEQLGEFLSQLRGALVPQCSLLSHVTLLPPRTLSAPVPQLVQAVGEGLRSVEPFRLKLGGVERFPVTDVIYISVDCGRGILETIHEVLNRGDLASPEPFPFHPHITLAQEIDPAKVDAVLDEAQRRWREWLGARTFAVERLTFVENANGSGWKTLAEFDLHAP